MTREDQLREARHFLGLPHPADKDDVSNALQYIEFRNQVFRATKQRHSKPMKRAARSLLHAMTRARKAGLPMPQDLRHAIGATPRDLRASVDVVRDTATSFLLWYYYIATTPSGAPTRADGFKQRLALQQAFWLLSDRDRPCVAGRKADWCKLAATLLGYPKPTAGLVSQARLLRSQFKRQLRDQFELEKMKILELEKMKIPGQI
jgi:hypothetical protein